VGDANGGYPGTFASVVRGVDHVRELATRFPRLDTTRVVLAGHSAGGQLALWAATRRRSADRYHPGRVTVPMPVAGVVSLAGITDLRAYGAAPGGCNSAVTPLLGGTPAELPEVYDMVSPVALVPIGVPLWLVHGAEDPIVPVSHSTDLAARERAAGGRAEVTVVEGAGHFDLVAPQAEAWAAVVRAVRELVGG